MNYRRRPIPRSRTSADLIGTYFIHRTYVLYSVYVLDLGILL